MSSPLPKEFYQRDDVVQIGKDLLGKTLMTNIGGVKTGGMIIETESYAGITDRASHAYGGRKTRRTAVMYKAGGIAYVYLCYGIHFLLNAVTSSEENPHAVLIRGILPTVGLPTILERTNKDRLSKTKIQGPGSLTKALGITLAHNGLSLSSDLLWIEEGKTIPEEKILVDPRIGVAYAKEDALLPYRFRILA